MRDVVLIPSKCVGNLRAFMFYVIVEAQNFYERKNNIYLQINYNRKKKTISSTILNYNF